MAKRKTTEEKERMYYREAALKKVIYEYGSDKFDLSENAGYRERLESGFYQWSDAVKEAVLDAAEKIGLSPEDGDGMLIPTPGDLNAIAGIRKVYPPLRRAPFNGVAGSEYPKKYQADYAFVLYVTHSILFGIPPRYFFWEDWQWQPKKQENKRVKRVSIVGPATPAIFEEDVELAGAHINRTTLSWNNPGRLEKEHGIYVVDVLSIEPDVRAYVALPTKDQMPEMVWTGGLLKGFILDPEKVRWAHEYVNNRLPAAWRLD